MSLSNMSASPSIDARELRHALGRFTTGVTVITTCDMAGRPVGLTANSFAAVSLDPPLVAWSLAARARSVPAFLASGRFAIHVLDATQEALSQGFAAAVEDRFAGIDWEAGSGGLPLLRDCLARFDCTAHQVIAVGNHVLFLGLVQRFRYREGAQLVFFASRYSTACPSPNGWRHEGNQDARIAVAAPPGGRVVDAGRCRGT
jgi:flavin reductase (DIM6/NTAB) family NADH-FMN oxidoreductase RutF